MNTKLLLCIISSSLMGAEPPLTDVLRVEGLDIPRKIEFVHKLEIPADTTTQLISLGCATSGLTIIGAQMIMNGSKEGQDNRLLPLAIGSALLVIGYVINRWNKQGATDETTKKDQTIFDDTSSNQLDQLSG